MNFTKHLCLSAFLLTAPIVCPAKVVKVSFSADTARVLRNPLNGWVMYMGRNWDADFWTQKGYDTMPTNIEGQTVRVSDYANTCYVRTSWNSMEPEEGKYFWNDSESRLNKLFKSVLGRRMKLAFRIVVDARDQGQNTPLYVRDAGAKGFYDHGNWSPYPDDSVFQAKYSKFIRAMAHAFNDADKVDFIDAYGLGKWGEAHGVKYADYHNKERVFQWITSLYASAFTQVPLIINYHRLVGDTISWAAPNERSRALLESAINKGYSLRHDAFGMTEYYGHWERNFASDFRYKRPIIMEGGWITGGHHRYWRDPSNRYHEHHSEDVRKGEYADASEAHVNMMDLRVGDETASWFGKSFDLVKRFIKEGGYRLYPSSATYNNKVERGGSISITVLWENMGWGYCPTNIPQWHQRYKVGYALADSDGILVKQWTDEESDLSQWLKDKPYHGQMRLSIQDIPRGNYTLLTSLVDVSKGGKPGIEIAVKEDRMMNGWVILGKLKIH